MSVPQRDEPVAAGRCTHADCRQAVIGPDYRRWLEWRLYVVVRS